MVIAFYGRFIFNFFFYVGVEPINNAVIVSGGRQRDSVVHIHAVHGVAKSRTRLSD